MDHIRDSTSTLTGLFGGPDFGEGVRAFLEKREPQWSSVQSS
jgi:enoyl-CoA hydratase/carnithine racemase